MRAVLQEIETGTCLTEDVQTEEDALLDSLLA